MLPYHQDFYVSSRLVNSQPAEPSNAPIPPQPVGPTERSKYVKNFDLNTQVSLRTFHDGVAPTDYGPI